MKEKALKGLYPGCVMCVLGWNSVGSKVSSGHRLTLALCSQRAFLVFVNRMCTLKHVHQRADVDKGFDDGGTVRMYTEEAQNVSGLKSKCSS